MGRGEGLGEVGAGLALPPDPRPRHPPLPPSGERGTQGQRWTQMEPNSPPPSTKGSPKQLHKDRQGAEPAPPDGEGDRAPGMEHRGLGG